MVIKRIGVLRLALFQAGVMVLFGVLAALFVTAFGSLLGSTGQVQGMGGVMFGAGVMTFFLFPVLYGIIGFISGVIGALLYNLVASVIGGIEIEVE